MSSSLFLFLISKSSSCQLTFRTYNLDSPPHELRPETIGFQQVLRIGRPASWPQFWYLTKLLCASGKQHETVQCFPGISRNSPPVHHSTSSRVGRTFAGVWHVPCGQQEHQISHGWREPMKSPYAYLLVKPVVLVVRWCWKPEGWWFFVWGIVLNSTV